MDLPPVEQPQRYAGLYVYDFGEWTAFGYTADEIAILLESETYRGGKTYRIHRVHPDGRLELCGVPAERFQLESGLFFYRASLEAARMDFAELRAAAERTPSPCRAFVHLVERAPGVKTARFVTALVFPAEYEADVGQWLSAIGFEGGERVEGGISHVTDYYAEDKTIIERQQLWSQATVPSRCAEEVFASVRRAVQR